MDLKLRYLALPAFAVALSVPASAVVVLDNFTAGATDLQIGTPTGSVESQQNVAVTGGQRDVWLSVTSNPFQRTARYEIVPAQGMSFYSSGPGLVGQVCLDYDGIETENLTDNQQTAGPGLNLNLSGEDRLRFNFSFADQGVTVRVDTYTFGTTTRQSTGTFTVGSGVTAATNFDLTFASMSAVAGGGTTLTDVDRIVVCFTGSGAASDFALGSIQAVPEPASMAALAVGALGLVARKRRRK
jgi:hypothetical protein